MNRFHLDHLQAIRSVVFLQCSDPALYPPLINGATLLADRGFRVTTLTAPILGIDIVLPVDPRIRVKRIRVRKSHHLKIFDYGRYLLSSAALALWARPDVVYASDIASAGPALLAQRLSGAKLIYHEHDSPNSGGEKSYLKRMRKIILRKADFVIFPNAKRADIVRAEYNLDPKRIIVVWNVPRRAELPAIVPIPDHPLILYYHGSISPERLPLSLVDAIRPFAGRIELRIAGYEAAGASGYLDKLLDRARTASGSTYATYIGQIPRRTDLLQEVTRAHIGLSLMPNAANDINMLHMAGASNKAFDYMAAGLPMLVSNLQDWQDIFVEPGYARACNPDDIDSMIAALHWFIDHPIERQAMGLRARAKIETEWNYDTAFAPIAAAIVGECGS